MHLEHTEAPAPRLPMNVINEWTLQHTENNNTHLSSVNKTSNFSFSGYIRGFFAQRTRRTFAFSIDSNCEMTSDSFHSSYSKQVRGETYNALKGKALIQAGEITSSHPLIEFNRK